MSPLYLREITYRAYVLADDEFGASDFDRDIVRDAFEPSDENTTLVKPGDTLESGWTGDDLVYYEGGDDLTIDECRDR